MALLIMIDCLSWEWAMMMIFLYHHWVMSNWVCDGLWTIFRCEAF